MESNSGQGNEQWASMGVEELEVALRYHNRKYWVDNAPEISDPSYDRLVEALRDKAPDSAVLDAIGEGGAIADDGDEAMDADTVKVRHDPPMLSLDKCYEEDTLLKWFGKSEGDVVVSPKVDGVAVCIRYDEAGQLTEAVRPRPYQNPHPPLARDCLSDVSIVSMGQIARPVLFRGRSIEASGKSISLYRETMESSGFDEAAVENALDNSWFWFEAHLAETDDEALDRFMPASEQAGRHVAEMRERWNPKDQEVSVTRPPLPRSAYGPTPNTTANENLIGSPRRVAEQLHLLREAGVRNLMLTNRGLMSKKDTEASLRLLSEKVMPQFR